LGDNLQGRKLSPGICSSDETSGGDPLEFNGLHGVGGDPNLKTVNVSYEIQWDIRYDDFSTIPVGGVVGHPEGLEGLPCPALWVPKIFDLGAARISNGASFTITTHTQGVASRVEDERVAENGLSENLSMGCGFGLCYTNSYIKPITKSLPE
jgi:hypothetical protein